MNQFTFRLPTQIVFGRDEHKRVGQLLKHDGARNVLVHYGGGSAKKSGLLAEIAASIHAAGLSSIEWGGVQPNPRLSLVRQGVSLCKEQQIDFILAVGGGSVIDSAKAIAAGAKIEADVLSLFTGEARSNGALPVAVVLTIAAAGSESSNVSVITNEDGWLKRSFADESLIPVFSILNPALTCTLPAYQSAAGMVDIMMHTMERYVTPTRHVDLSDRLCEGLLRSVIANAPIVMHDPQNYDARAEIMWAGTLSHNGLMDAGRKKDFSVHQLEHELSGMFDVTHGAGLAALWGSWARYVRNADPARFLQYANRVWDVEINPYDTDAVIEEGIRRTEAFFHSLGMPTCLGELGLPVLTEQQLEELTYKCTFQDTRTVGSMRPLDHADILQIYRMANH